MSPSKTSLLGSTNVRQGYNSDKNEERHKLAVSIAMK